MKLTIEIEIAGAAFFPEEHNEDSDLYDAAAEVQRIVDDALDSITLAVVGNRTVPLFDINGNRVGSIALTDTSDPVVSSAADRRLVADDRRESYPEQGLSDDEAVALARNTIPLSAIEGDDELAQAYRRVLGEKY